MPKLLTTPFAASAAPEYRTDIQNSTGEYPNSATYQNGFPPITFQPLSSSGIPPKGADFNGVLYDITDNIVFLTQGGVYPYNAAYATSIGGYPLNARIALDNGDIVRSTIPSNTNDPNTDMTGWVNVNDASQIIDASGETQQQVNYNGGAKWHSRVGGYLENERVVLANGDIVKSTIDGNTNNPNSDMTGWAYSSLIPSKNLNDVPDKAAARTNLGVYSKAETDSIAVTPSATETVAGKAKIATTTIARVGTNDTDIITPLKLKNTVFGLGQTRKVVTKTSGITYTNTTGKPIGFEVIFKCTTTGAGNTSSNITVNSEIRRNSVTLGGDTNYRWSMFVIILPDEYYSFNAVSQCAIEKVTEIS